MSKNKLPDSETLQRQAVGSTKEQFSSSPHLTLEQLDAVITRA